MNQLSYVANLPFELTLDEYTKIMNDIRSSVADNLMKMRGSGITFTQAGLSEDCFCMLRDSLKESYNDTELLEL